MQKITLLTAMTAIVNRVGLMRLPCFAPMTVPTAIGMALGMTVMVGWSLAPTVATAAQSLVRTTIALQPSAAQPSLPLQQVRLLARQETRPPLGVRPQPNRAIGFAEVFLSLSNPTNQEMTLQIQRIEIVEANTGQRQAFTSQRQALPHRLRLRPLENAEHLIQLSNRTGYSGKTNVKAIVTYRFQGRVYQVTSAAVAIDS